MIKILIGVVVATIAVIGVFLVLDPRVGITSTGTTDVTETAKNTFTVSVEGAVYKPGSYTMEENATMDDLINAAGGTTSAVDERAYYSEALLVNGMSYFIASRYDTTDLCAVYCRKQTDNPDLLIYITDSRQSLHFEQLFRASAMSGIQN